MGRHALVIAVGTFRDASPDRPSDEIDDAFVSLDFTRRRAEDTARQLRRLGYRVATDAVLVDADRMDLRDAIEKAITADDIVVVHFVGHGAWDQRSGTYYLAGADATPDAMARTGVNICEQFDRVDADPSGPPTLFVLDACGSGRAVGYVVGQDRRDQDRRAWVLAASHADDPAFSGRFSAALADVLGRIAEGGVDIAASEAHVRLEKIRDLVQEALDAEPAAVRQIVELTARRSRQPAPPFVPNPLFDPKHLPLSLDDVADLEHFRQVAAGIPDGFTPAGSSSEQPSLFSGRATVLSTLAAWLHGSAAEPGSFRVVTGSPGSGKSAIIGAIVCSGHPTIRRLAPELHRRLSPRCRPPDLTNVAIVHARGRDRTAISTSIARQLGWPLPPEYIWSPAAIIEAITILGDRPLIILDALDEAVDAVAVMRDLLLPLLAGGAARLLVGVRPWAELVALREAARETCGLIDLDDEPDDAVVADVADYLSELFQAFPAYADYDHRRRIVAMAAPALTTLDAPFLAAGLFAQAITAGPRQPATDAEVRDALPGGLGALLDLRLGQLAASAPQARAVLETLALAKGQGMPRSLIARGAGTVGYPLTEAATATALDAVEFFLRPGVDQDGTVLYRLFHQALDDHLRAAAATNVSPAVWLDRLLGGLRPAAPAEQPVIAPLAWDRAEPYLLRHALAHAADAGRADELLADTGFLTYAWPGAVAVHLPDARSLRAREYAAVYRTSLARHRTSPPDERASVLAIDAARWGLDEIATRFTASPWRVRWATGSHLGGATRGSSSIGDWVNAIATTVVSGRPVCVTGGEDGSVQLHDVELGASAGWVLGHHHGPVRAVATAFVRGAPHAITGGVDGRVMLWDLQSRDRAGVLASGRLGAINALTTVDLNGRTAVAAGGSDGGVMLLDLSHHTTISVPLRSSAAAVHGLAAWRTPAGTTALLVAMSNGVVRNVDALTGGSAGAALTGHVGAVNAVAAVRLGGLHIAITGGGDQTVRSWDLLTGATLDIPAAPHGGPVTAIATITAGRRMLAVSTALDGTAGIWDLEEQATTIRTLTAGPGPLLAADTAWIGGSPIAATGGGDGQLRTWDLAAEPVGRPRRGHSHGVSALQCTTVADQAVLCSGDGAGSILIHTRDHGEPVGAPMIRHDGRVSGIAATAAGPHTWLASGSWDWSTRISAVPSGAERPPLYGHVGGVTAVATAQLDRTVILTAGRDGGIQLWNPSTGAGVGHISTDHIGGVTAMATGRLHDRIVAVTGGYDGKVGIWDLATLAPVIPSWTGHNGQVVAVAIHSIEERPRVVSCAASGELCLWDPDLGIATAAHPTGHDGVITAMATVDLGGRAAAVTGDSAGYLRTTSLVTGEPAAAVVALPEPVRALRVAGRDLLAAGLGDDVALLAYAAGPHDWAAGAPLASEG